MADVYNSQLDAFERYHLYYERQRNSTLLDGPALPAIGHAAAGATGSAISSVVVYPLDLIVTRLQIQRQHRKGGEAESSEQYRSIIDAAQKIYHREGGLKALYAGVSEDTAKSIADAFLFFLSYNFLRKMRERRLRAVDSHLSAMEELSVGFAAGAFSKLLTTPIANVVTRLQTSSMTAQGRNKRSAMDVARQIRREKGVHGFWSGYSATLILTLNPSLTFFFFETLKRFTLPRRLREHPHPTATFLIAAVSKALASTITYPFSMAKARAQASEQTTIAKDKSPSAQRSTVFATVAHIARTEGIGALYEGLEGEVLKGFFSHGTTMLVKEGVHALVIRLYYAILKALRRYPSPQELAERASDQASETFQAAKDRSQAAVGKIQRFGDESATIATQQTSEALSAARSGVQAANESVQDTTNRLAEMTDKLVKDAKSKVSPEK